jgi:mannose-1-phosphate guanylyltransferase/mannose-6-phosphate isomerase
MKNNRLITPLILAGGSGTRLWPISRKDKPKQFLEIFNSYSLLQLTTLRCKNKIFNEPIFIVGEEHRFIVAEQLRTIGFTSPHIILEPEPKNTTAAITVGALYAKNINLTQPLLVLPSDHYIENTKEFVDLVHKTSKSNITNKLICFGIQPTAPEAKYGYILKKDIDEDRSLLKKIDKFVEKPSELKAKNLILRNALWNSGMFFFNADSVINEVKFQSPLIYKNSKLALDKAIPDMDFIRLDAKSFKKITSISIDHAVFEKANNSYVVPTSLNWNDLGTYNALWDIGKKDKYNNVINGDVIIDNVKNSYIYSDKNLVAVSNIDNVNVVSTQNATLVTSIKKSNEIKSLISILGKNNRTELSEHVITHRPWGYFENISSNKNHKIKKLTVMPGKKLSLQSHSKRSEHWVVISGIAKVTQNEKEFILNKNESTFIPVNVKHRLVNTSKVPLIIIEVQTGKYFGEDDIKRFEDVYGRIK